MKHLGIGWPLYLLQALKFITGRSSKAALGNKQIGATGRSKTSARMLGFDFYLLPFLITENENSILGSQALERRVEPCLVCETLSVPR